MNIILTIKHSLKLWKKCIRESKCWVQAAIFPLILCIDFVMIYVNQVCVWIVSSVYFLQFCFEVTIDFRVPKFYVMTERNVIYQYWWDTSTTRYILILQFGTKVPINSPKDVGKDDVKRIWCVCIGCYKWLINSGHKWQVWSLKINQVHPSEKIFKKIFYIFYMTRKKFKKNKN